MFGPSEATRTEVLRHLLLRSYDVLHYAGHCVYDESNPARQGWVFTDGDPPDLLSPHELNRIDRIPKFVFSNACESGITPDRSEEREVALAPGFAEAFFKRGVANFVCTAWPVDDGAARTLAVTLYSHLLASIATRNVQAGTGRLIRCQCGRRCRKRDTPSSIPSGREDMGHLSALRGSVFPSLRSGNDRVE